MYMYQVYDVHFQFYFFIVSNMMDVNLLSEGKKRRQTCTNTNTSSSGNRVRVCVFVCFCHTAGASCCAEVKAGGALIGRCSKAFWVKKEKKRSS